MPNVLRSRLVLLTKLTIAAFEAKYNGHIIR